MFYANNIYFNLIHNSRNVELEVEPTLEEAVADYREGNEEALEWLLAKYQPKLVSKARQCHCDIEEAVQELRICLWQCVMKYKFGGPTKFNTYFWTAAHHWLGSVGNKKIAKRRTAEGGFCSLYSENEEGDMLLEMFEDTADAVFRGDAEFLLDIEENLKPRIAKTDYLIIKYICKGSTKVEAAKKVGISNVAVHNHIRAMRKNTIILDFFRPYLTQA